MEEYLWEECMECQRPKFWHLLFPHLRFDSNAQFGFFKIWMKAMRFNFCWSFCLNSDGYFISFTWCLPHVCEDVYKGQWLSCRPSWYPLLCICLSCLRLLCPQFYALESSLHPLDLWTIKISLKPAKLHRICVYDQLQATRLIKSSSPLVDSSVKLFVHCL